MVFLFIFILGLFVGSFLGVLIDRIPKDETVVKGRSHCDFCKKELKWNDLIPVFSFVTLGGKCRYCRAKLSLFYPVTELTTGLLFVLAYFFVIANPLTLNLKLSVNLFYYLFMVSSLMVIFFTDVKYGIIADKILFPASLISLFYLFFFQRAFLFNHLLSAAGAFLFFVLISYIFFVFTKKESMGGGDIKLSLFLGLFLGFPDILVGLYIAFLTGAFVAIILIIWKKKSFRKGTLPFGPFMVIGALISLFWGGLVFSNALAFLGI